MKRKRRRVTRLPIRIAGLISAIVICGCGDGYTSGQPSGADETEADAGTIEADSAPAVREDLLIDDFEDGDGYSLTDGGWFDFDDSSDNAASVITITKDDDDHFVMDGEGYESERALFMSYRLDSGDWPYSPYVGFGVTLFSDDDTPFDASGYMGITYMYKGPSHTMNLATYDVEDHDTHRITVPAAVDWRRVTVFFEDFRQEGWGDFKPFNLDNAKLLMWIYQTKHGDGGDVWVDDVVLLARTETSKEPDMEIKDPEPPEDAVIDTVEMDNPLQSLAMSALDRGYNMPDWLEAAKFESFEYDEAFIEQVAQAGFEALRLPIDLDLYIADREAYFDGATELAIDPALFEVLDAFEAWTATHNLSFTIDYHQYDGSFDMENDRYTDAVLGLWSSVAAHFADNPREDIFLEIMNEPELAGGTDEVSAEAWGAFAGEIIAAIRNADPTRVILFGDVLWNGIDALVERDPFDDDRIIYVFHYYEPLIFTHQGSMWIDMSSTHGIPYPYSPERWSAYFADFGFIPSLQPEWQLDALRNYYKTGNKSWIRNAIVKAKQWAVDNNVPVICNELGAYDRTSDAEDRLRYYTDLIDIFDELQIPWQHWFHTIDTETGEMDTALAEALGMQ